MTDHNNHAFSSFDINGTFIRNRFALAPMTRVSASEDGTVTKEMVQYYERFARGGFGLLMTEGLYTDQRYSQGYRSQPGMSDDFQAQSWRALITAAHTHSTPVFAQLMHAGALSQANRFKPENIAPSAIQPSGEEMAFYYGNGPYKQPLAMTDEHIADVIAGFTQAAHRAISVAGFDGLEIHGANGYLLDQFLTDYTNVRGDKWGGDLKNRLRLTVEILKAVRLKVGDNTPVGVRISQGKVNNFLHKWEGREADAETIFGTIADSGVDFIHVTEHDALAPAFDNGGHSLSRLAKRFAPGIAIITNGGLHDPARIAQALEEGGDMIAIGKAALANPDLPDKLQKGIALDEFDAAILGPIANIKEAELA
ncbi:NADH:flavin oxidoreductase [Pseudomonas sp. Irchel 3A5]|uniref:NADH:flavin oxidoreductase n=1 Tax=Pseudomonas sp. Irchel 3A5 TaxID=2008911 RepID=UPI000BA335BE|nr:NADH:flavin oxidoreductase [Pseudomonas sp. Irchel 3A5]